MKSHYVYVHIRKDTMQPFYVGMGSEYRSSYKGKGRTNKEWREIALTVGYFIEIPIEGLTAEQAVIEEARLIKQYRDQGIALCNKTEIASVRKGWNHKPETKRLISETNKKTFVEKNRGQQISEKALERWSDPEFKEKTRQAMIASVATKKIHSGDSHARSDKTVYSFVHDSGEKFVGKRFELAKHANLQGYGVGWIVTGKKKSYKGWRLA